MKLRFFGAVGEVSGICYLLSLGERWLLVECGLVQDDREPEASEARPQRIADKLRLPALNKAVTL